MFGSRQIDLDFTTPRQAADSLRQIAVEVEEGRARVIGIAKDPRNPSVLVFKLLGARHDS